MLLPYCISNSAAAQAVAANDPSLSYQFDHQTLSWRRLTRGHGSSSSSSSGLSLLCRPVMTHYKSHNSSAHSPQAAALFSREKLNAKAAARQSFNSCRVLNQGACPWLPPRLSSPYSSLASHLLFSSNFHACALA